MRALHESDMRPTSHAPRRHPAAGTVSVRAVATIIDVGVAAGIPRDTLMCAADASARDLNDPDARLPVAAIIALWEAIARRTRDPGFGVGAGAALRVRQLGLLGYVACFSPTLLDAWHRIHRYGRLITEEVEISIRESRPGATLAIRRIAPGWQQPLSQDYLLAGALQMSRELTAVDIVPLEVRVTYERPSSAVAHIRHFRCPLHFGASTTALIFRLSDLSLPIVRADETLAGYLSEYADVVLSSLTRGSTMRHTVRAAIWSVLGEGKPSLERVAAALRIPPRTMQRRLSAEGTSLHREIEEIRKTMATALLRDRSYSIADVAFLLGFSEPSAFFRSFRRWTGATPRQFRTEERETVPLAAAPDATEVARSVSLAN